MQFGVRQTPTGHAQCVSSLAHVAAHARTHERLPVAGSVRSTVCTVHVPRPPHTSHDGGSSWPARSSRRVAPWQRRAGPGINLRESRSVGTEQRRARQYIASLSGGGPNNIELCWQQRTGRRGYRIAQQARDVPIRVVQPHEEMSCRTRRRVGALSTVVVLGGFGLERTGQVRWVKAAATEAACMNAEGRPC